MEGKIAIGRLAASLVEPHDSLIFDVRTTVVQAAIELPLTHRNIVLTNSLQAIDGSMRQGG